MTSLIGLIRRNYRIYNPPSAYISETSETYSPKPLKFGILGAAVIAPIVLVLPARSHPLVVVHAIAARDRKRAEAFAKRHNIPKVCGSYQELLDDPEVDAIYNPLPNGLHYEWTMKALAAGKHVLLEKPSANTADETQAMFELAEKMGLVLLEAFHYRFHPAVQKLKAVIDSKELGAIKSIEANLAISRGLIKEDDIRYKYDLGGGALMDMGCYTLNCIRYISSSNPTRVLSASHELHSSQIDRQMTATLALPNDAVATITCDLGIPFKYGFIPSLPQIEVKVVCEGGEAGLYNFVGPTFYHKLWVQPHGLHKRVYKAYTFGEGGMEGQGEDWWTTYRYQLEAFVEKIMGREPQTWVSREDSVANMEWIERVYEKSGLRSRPRSNFVG